MKKFFGFSLIEILIVLSIIGILSAFCFPAYSHYFSYEKRIEAEITLSKLAVALEQYFTTHNTYQNATLQNLGFAEKTAGNSYQLAIISSTDSEFFLAAKPINNQAKQDARCATLTLNSRGEKNISGSGTVEECW